MPDSSYLVRYASYFHDNVPHQLATNWTVIQLDGIDLDGQLYGGLMPLPACSRFEIDFDWRIAENPVGRIVDFYLSVQFPATTEHKIGEVFVPFSPPRDLGEDGPLLVNCHFIFSTPQQREPWNIFVLPRAGPPLRAGNIHSEATLVQLFYLGSSVSCGDIAPPPPFDAWCEPFPPSDADTADQLQEIHMERMAALADGF